MMTTAPDGTKATKQGKIPLLSVIVGRHDRHDRHGRFGRTLLLCLTLFVGAQLSCIVNAAAPQTTATVYLPLSARPANLDMSLSEQPTVLRVSPDAADCRFGVFVITPGSNAAGLTASATTAVTQKQPIVVEYAKDKDDFCIVSTIASSPIPASTGTTLPASVGTPGNPDVGVYDGYHNAFATAHKSAFRDFGQGKFDESVDPITGRLSITHTDVVVPGVNGLDIRVMRTYISPDPSEIVFSLKSGCSLEPQFNGFGWHVIANFGGIRGMVGACDMYRLAGNADAPSDYSGYYLRAETLPQWINAAGHAEPLVPVANEGQNAIVASTVITWRTASGTTVTCGPGDYQPIATLTDGTQIEMNVTTTLNTILGAWNAFPTKITDRWGNWLAFEYDTAYTALFFGASQVRQGHLAAAVPLTRITASDGRVVSFVYASGVPGWTEASGQAIPVTEKILNRIEYGSAATDVYKVQYTYDRTLVQGLNVLASSSAKYFLRRVDTPDALNWQYDYGALPADLEAPAAGQTLLQTLTYPNGGTASYGWGGSKTTSPVTALTPGVLPKSFQIRSKTTSEGGTWRYSYTDMVRTAADETNDPIPTLDGRASGAGAPLPYLINGVFVNLEAGRVTGPTGVEVYHHFPRYSDPTYSDFQNVPPGYASPVETWRLGRLLQHTTYPLGTSFSAAPSLGSQVTTQTYVPIYFPIGGLLGDQQSVLPIRYGACSDSRCPAGDASGLADKTALLVRPVATTLTQGVNAYTSTNDTYMAFCGRPTTVTENGQRNRSMVFVFDRTGYCQTTSQQTNENGARRARTATTLTPDLKSIANETRYGPTDTAGLTTSFTYNAAGEVATATDARGFATFFNDYKRGTPQTEWHPVSTTSGATDPDRIAITRIVDDLGRITVSVQPPHLSK